jgi:hypothetical protein
MTPIEEAVTRGAVAALRRRQVAQLLRASRGRSVETKDGCNVVRMSGEGAIAAQLAAVLNELADELEQELAR